jgi:succinyl-CoA synthetase alpha subunit
MASSFIARASARRFKYHPSMTAPAISQLPFLEPALDGGLNPWRVAVINPTGRYARHQVAGLKAAGTPLIGGVALGRGGETLDGLPLYDRVADLPEPPNVAMIYTPAEGVRDAIMECTAARIRTIVAVAEYVPVHDAIDAAAAARAAGSWLVGPNTLGLFVPGRGLLGSIAPSFCTSGRLAVIARSGTLTLAMARQLTAAGIGQSVVAHIGGDTVAGRNPHEYLAALAHHDGTDAVLYCGEIGGDKEYALAQAMRGYPKPVVALVVGRAAPPEKRMGHAGALVGSARESAQAKLDALAAAGCKVAKGPEQAITILKELALAKR